VLPTQLVACPYCGEPIELVIDDSVPEQRYVEDCSVCCRPIEVHVIVDESSELRVSCNTDMDA
jgi:Cysteine-rich CPXCG